jgi:hypothetical protein
VGEVAAEVVAEVKRPAPARPRQAIESLGRIFAMLLLPLSIAPVLLLGPSVLRAPIALFNEAWGDVQRLERDLLPAHHARPHVVDDVRGMPTVSFGPVYGRWSAFPQHGRTRPGVQQLGPEGWTR